jgi:hypothetical protein
MIKPLSHATHYLTGLVAKSEEISLKIIVIRNYDVIKKTSHPRKKHEIRNFDIPKYVLFSGALEGAKFETLLATT